MLATLYAALAPLAPLATAALLRSCAHLTTRPRLFCAAPISAAGQAFTRLRRPAATLAPLAPLAAAAG